MMRTKFGKLRLNLKKTALRQGDVSKALELSSGRWGLAKHPKNAEGRPKEFEGMHKVAATGTKKFYVSPTYYRIFHKRLTSASPAAMERLVRGGKPLGRSRGEQIIIGGYERQRRQLIVQKRFVDRQCAGEVNCIVTAQFIVLHRDICVDRENL